MWVCFSSQNVPDSFDLTEQIGEFYSRHKNTKDQTVMHSRAKTNTTAPPRKRVAITAVIAILAMLALFLGLAAPPAAADTGQQIVLTTAPPPDLDVGLVTSDIASPQKFDSGFNATIEQLTRGSASFKIQPVVLDTSPPAASAVQSVNNVTAVASPQTSTEVAIVKSSLTSGQAKHLSTGNAELLTERLGTRHESALISVVANGFHLQVPLIRAITIDADVVGRQLATAVISTGVGG